ncbi:hypothetical protein FHW96_001780 [Novosphingobium sp. SG751A]|uniref:hypothetical protein n=1 Tax=Novosphingobium sp. SG751A TaxID=2587000 RepID=UPI0015547740|nr:hypothetical protein [Novosphingobium sp. SG751A]NOW45625.1 hypothetical protein [Novosphingobium sp. SG751A]
MFLDTRDPWPPPDPWSPPPRRDPNRRREGLVMSLVGLNLLLLFIAPIAGITFFDIALALWHRF